MKNCLIAMLTLLITSVFTSCNDRIEGVGPVVTQELDLQEFTSFELNGSFDVEVYYGEVQKVEAIGQQNIIDRLNTWVGNEHWNIDLEDGSYNRFSLKIKITIPELTKAVVDGSGDIRIYSAKSSNIDLQVRGSGDMYIPAAIKTPNKAKLLIDGSGNINADKIEAVELTTVIEGSGNITVKGEVETNSILIDGSGNFNAFGLNSEKCTVRVEGSGRVSIDVNETLDVSIEGSGDVHYRGNPTVTTNIDGSGSVKKAN